MAINSTPDGWPWSALGVSETTDKDAIRAAYDAKRAELDAQAMRISAFAELTEAREKALFLASELLREQERSGVVAPVDSVAPAQEPPAEPEPEPEPEVSVAIDFDLESGEEAQAEPAWERGGRYASNDDIVASFGLEDDDELEGRHEESEEFWEAERNFGSPAPGDGPTPFLRRYSLDKYGIWWLFGIMMLLGYCTLSSEEEPYPVEVVQTQPLPPVASPSQLDLSDFELARADTMAATLFGDEFDFAQVTGADPTLATQLAESMQSDEEGVDQPRALLRVQILKARPFASIEQALAIAELHVAWLQTAQAAGDGACREVTSELFFNGVPDMRNDWITFEQSVAADLLRTGALRQASFGYSVPDGSVPEWVLTSAASDSGIPLETLRAAASDGLHPERCATEMALLQAMLRRPETVTNAMLGAI